MSQTPVVAPVRERGYMHDPVSYGPNGGMYSWDDLTNEATPELQWPLSVEVFHRMESTDPTASANMRAVTTPITRTPARLNGSGCRDEVVEHVSRNIAVPIKGSNEAGIPADQVPLRGYDRFAFRDHLPNALLSLKYGHAYHEQVYWLDESGLAHIRKLALRPSRTIRRINVARDGGLDSIEQKPAGSAFGVRPWAVEGRVIPVKRLVAYVNEREGSNWLGKSLLRSSYKNWLLKDRDLRVMSMSNDRNGMGVPTYTAAEGESSLDAGLAIAGRVRSGEHAGAALPHGATLELQGVKGSLPDILASIRYHDEQMARGVLAHFLNLGAQAGGQVGSYNLGSVLANTFNTSLAAVASSIATTFNRHVITDLVEANWGPDEPVPVLEFDDLAATETELDRLRQVTGLTDDNALAAWMRKQLSAGASQEDL